MVKDLLILVSRFPWVDPLQPTLWKRMQALSMSLAKLNCLKKKEEKTKGEVEIKTRRILPPPILETRDLRTTGLPKLIVDRLLVREILIKTIPDRIKELTDQVLRVLTRDLSLRDLTVTIETDHDLTDLQALIDRKDRILHPQIINT